MNRPYELYEIGARAAPDFSDLDRAYSKRAVQPICAVQDAICAVQNEKLCSPKTHKVEDIIVQFFL